MAPDDPRDRGPSPEAAGETSVDGAAGRPAEGDTSYGRGTDQPGAGVTQPTTLDLDSLWKQSLAAVTSTVSSPAQRQWLAATRPVGFSEDTVILATPHAFAREWLDTRCGDRIRTAISEAAGRPLTVVITVQPKPEPLDGYTGPAPDVEAETEAAAPESSAPQASEPAPAPEPPVVGETTSVPAASEAPGHESQPHHQVHQTPPPTPQQPANPQGTVTPPPAAPPTPDPTPEPEHAPRPAAYDQQPQRPAAPEERGGAGPSQPGRAEQQTFEQASLPGADDDRPLEAPGRPPGPTVHLPPQRPTQPEVSPDTQLNDKYVFDDFVIGASNRFAHAAAVAVAEAPAKSYNPLFIYGGAGLGKTHLLHAIGHYVQSLYPRLQVRYVTTEQFTNEFINAIRDDQITHFQRLYRRSDVLLIDDIQFLENKERTQEEFFHTFNALHNAEKQIVISSDRPPKQIAQLEDRLRSRFEWGLMTDVQPPDLETRIAILRKKSEADDLNVAPDVLELIASKVQSNIRELEGALIRVKAYASLQRSAADTSMAEMVLKDLFPDDREQEITTPMIMEEVAGYFQLTVDDLCSKSRSRQLVTARQIAMYLVREMTDLSLPRIGKHFGGRDHTTVMHANNKIANLMQERRAIYDQVQELTNRIKTRARTA